jgi:hypothetical protein
MVAAARPGRGCRTGRCSSPPVVRRCSADRPYPAHPGRRHIRQHRRHGARSQHAHGSRGRPRQLTRDATTQMSASHSGATCPTRSPRQRAGLAVAREARPARPARRTADSAYREPAGRRDQNTALAIATIAGANRPDLASSTPWKSPTTSAGCARSSTGCSRRGVPFSRGAARGLLGERLRRGLRASQRAPHPALR